jgi:hypothetical protein
LAELPESYTNRYYNEYEPRETLRDKTKEEDEYELAQ